MTVEEREDCEYAALMIERLQKRLTAWRTAALDDCLIRLEQAWDAARVASMGNDNG